MLRNPLGSAAGNWEISAESRGWLGYNRGVRSDKCEIPAKEISMIRRGAISGDNPCTRMFCWSLIGLTLPYCATQVAEGCTSFAMKCEHGLLFGSNFDNDFRPGLLYVNKRGVSKSGWPMDESDTPATWTITKIAKRWRCSAPTVGNLINKLTKELQGRG